MADYYLKIGDEIFKLSLEDLIKAIKAEIVEENDQVYSPTETEGFWKKIREVDALARYFPGRETRVEYVIDEDVPPLKKELLRRQHEMREKLNKKGIVLKCEKCGETRNVIPSGVYKGKFLCRKCEEYYKIEGIDVEEDKDEDEEE